MISGLAIRVFRICWQIEETIQIISLFKSQYSSLNIVTSGETTNQSESQQKKQTLFFGERENRGTRGKISRRRVE